jgi:transposase
MVVGIDVAKRSMVAIAVAEDGRSGRRFRFNNCVEGFRRLQQYADRMATQFGAVRYEVALEPTGPYGEALAAWLQTRDIVVVAVPPLKTKRAKEIYDGTWRKTDDKDAYVVADLCRSGHGRRWQRPIGVFAMLRVLSRRRRRIVQQRSAIAGQLDNHCDVMFPERQNVFSKVFGKASRWQLRHVATPQAVLEIPFEQLKQGLRQASRGQVGDVRARALVDAARGSVGVTEGSEARCIAIKQLLDEYEQQVEQLATVEQAMTAALEQVPYAQHLLTLPCVGAMTVAALLGELGDFRRYRVAKQLIKAAGLDLVEVSSGDHRGQKRISHRGNPYVRKLLYMAALRAGRQSLQARRRRLVDKHHKPPAKAAVANMHALLRIGHALVRDQVDFDPHRYEAATR